MMNGWLTTKKKGQDDAQIEEDRTRALESRRGTKPKKKKAAARPKAAKRKKAKTNYSSDDESADDSIGDFVVEDEDEELVEDNVSSSEDELMMQASKPKARKRKTDTTFQESESSSSSDNEEEGRSSSFLAPYKKRTSRPPPARKPAPKAHKKPVKARRIEKKVSQTVDLLSSEDDDFDVDVDLPNNNKKQSVLHIDGFSSDDDVPTATSKPTATNVATAQQSRFFAKSSKVATVAKAPAPKLESDDDDDSPMRVRKRKSGNKQKRIFADDDDSDESVGVSKPQRPAHASAFSQDDFASDEDEALALTLALSKSEQESNTNEQELVDLLEDSSEDEGDEQDAYDAEDADAQAAGSVLATANELSAHVLQTMTKWSTARQGDGDSAVPMGMIVDGALALSGMDASNPPAESTNHSWITQEVMKEVCPKVTLAGYQLIGVNWMALLHGMKCEVKGGTKNANVNGILADEMGLGKTVQTIAFLSWLKYTNNNCDPKAGGSFYGESDANAALVRPSNGGGGPHLVIAPSSVLQNWKREFDKFAPHLNVVKYHGSQNERVDLQMELRLHLPGGEAKLELSGTDPVDVILAPVTYFQKEKSDDRAFLRKFQYDYLVVDEAHTVCKNAKGTRYKSLDKFTTAHRLLLTGTPVQNNPKELMALLCFLMPLFSSKSAGFDDDSANDGGESMLQHFVSLESGHAGDASAAAYKKLKQLFAPFVLRRSKADVLSQILPPKERRVEFVELDKMGRKTYDAILANHIEAKRKGDSSVREHLFTQLRKAAHHPLMLRTRYTSTGEKKHLVEWFYRYGAFQGEGATKAKVAEELERWTDFQIHLAALGLIEDNELRRSEVGRYVLSADALFSSAKFAKLRSLLPQLVADGHRVLIFSVWTSCLDLLGCLLEHMNLDFLRMDGSTAVSERQDLIDKFNQDATIPVFLLSTKACGMGINLTAADTCIVHDLDFNPFNDLQAEDRCHRIGQTRPVTVLKLVAKDTVDMDIYAMQQRKARMNAAIMENGSSAELKKEERKDKAAVLQTAVNRFLQSPPPAKNAESPGDENQSENQSEKSSAFVDDTINV